MILTQVSADKVEDSTILCQDRKRRIGEEFDKNVVKYIFCKDKNNEHVYYQLFNNIQSQCFLNTENKEKSSV